jgi:hypothetical protein
MQKSGRKLKSAKKKETIRLATKLRSLIRFATWPVVYSPNVEIFAREIKGQNISESVGARSGCETRIYARLIFRLFIVRQEKEILAFTSRSQCRNIN